MSCASLHDTNLCLAATFYVWPAMLGDPVPIVKELKAVGEKMDDKFMPISDNSPADRLEFEIPERDKIPRKRLLLRRRSTSRLGGLYTC